MAPLHSLVHSPKYDRGNRTTLPSSSYTSSPNRAPESFPKGLLKYLFHDGEGTPSVAVSLIKVESKTKYVRNTNGCYELQYADTSASYCSLQENFLSPNTYSEKANIMSTSLVNLSIKSEPDIDGASCSLLKSLRDQDARFIIKAEPDQNSELDLKPAVFDQRVSDQAAATIPGICSTEKPQDDTFPTIDDPQPCRDTCDTDLSDRYQVRAKMPSTGSGSNVEPQGIVSTQSASANVIRTPLLKKRRVATYSKLALYSQLRRLLRADVPQLPSHAAAHPTLNPQPPDDGGHEFPHHDGHPQSSRLYKSLYGLAQCLRSQVETSASSLNPNDASNTPVFNQAGVNGDGASGPSSTEMPNNYVNDSGRHLNLGPHETTNDVGLETLDPHSLYQLGMLCLTLALELAMGATSVGTSQHHIPDLVSTLSGLPVPLPMQLNEPDTHGHFPSVHPARTPGTQTHHQSYFSESYQDSAEQSEQRSAGVNASQLQADIMFGGESPIVHPDVYGHAFPSDMSPNQPSISISGYNYPNSSVPPSPSFANINQHIQIFRVTDLTPDPLPIASANGAPNSGQWKCCPCGRRFRRSNSLVDHMHMHTGNKRHQCPFCVKRFAYGSGLSRHLKNVHKCNGTA